MTSGNVTCCLGGELARQLGKKGTVSDVTLYNVKVGDSVLSFIEPTAYPEKIQSLVSSINMADQAILEVNALDANLAEAVVALDMAGLERGYTVVDPKLKEAFNGVASGTVVAGYEPVEPAVAQLRGRLAQLRPDPEGPKLVQIDHCFPVKGVGTVALGVVKGGTVKKYDKLHYGSGQATIKSIQVHDNDVAEAPSGIRVGLCLKDTKPDDIPRGTLLSQQELPMSQSIKGAFTLSAFAPRALEEGDQVLANAWLNYVPAKVEKGAIEPGKTADITLALEKPVPLAGGRLSILDPGLKMPRVFGWGDLK